MKAKDLYDIAIIGTGPAGATLARLLHPKYKIIAIDKKNPHGDGFQKPCGGLICTDAQKALASFDLTLPKDVLVDPQIFAVKTIDLKNKLIRIISGSISIWIAINSIFGWNLSCQKR